MNEIVLIYLLFIGVFFYHANGNIQRGWWHNELIEVIYFPKIISILPLKTWFCPHFIWVRGAFTSSKDGVECPERPPLLPPPLSSEKGGGEGVVQDLYKKIALLSLSFVPALCLPGISSSLHFRVCFLKLSAAHMSYLMIFSSREQISNRQMNRRCTRSRRNPLWASRGSFVQFLLGHPVIYVCIQPRNKDYMYRYFYR